ncbi:PTS glucose transporter subunit IIB [Mycoplasma struthionis]|uniref:PTS glucose transporter subunit IIB n=1 Tax=Mycoplasma struthionis TaxID=538220 RepID=A0A3G8LJ67_9MOLU|nr:PTS glucose transporter subunit IIB [Mycoplasma struthionis]AZG68910.1 PTS glucose transporter subunit IIB [Mycoplasma struthionis]TPI01153.1 PTS glucose transporter subunit IIB [Mycoplasma struthionis]
MTAKQKALYVFLCIITLGFILIYWKNKYQKREVSSELSVNNNLPFSLNDLFSKLGQKENIESVSATQKIIKIFFKNRNLILVDEIKKLGGISGIALQKNSISLVIGNCAKYLEELMKKEL